MTDEEKEYIEAQEEIVELCFKHIEECEKLEKKVHFGDSLIDDSSGASHARARARAPRTAINSSLSRRQGGSSNFFTRHRCGNDARVHGTTTTNDDASRASQTTTARSASASSS